MIRYGLISGMGYGLADLNLGLMTASTAEGGLAVARLMGAGLVIGLMLAKCVGDPASAMRRRVRMLSSMRRSVPIATMQFTAGMPVQVRLLRLNENMKRGLQLCVLAGFLDCLGQLGYVLSATQGKISVAAALVAMYPAVSVELAVWLLKEHIDRRQLAGLMASFVSIVLLSQ